MLGLAFWRNLSVLPVIAPVLSPDLGPAGSIPSTRETGAQRRERLAREEQERQRRRELERQYNDCISKAAAKAFNALKPYVGIPGLQKLYSGVLPTGSADLGPAGVGYAIDSLASRSLIAGARGGALGLASIVLFREYMNLAGILSKIAEITKENLKDSEDCKNKYGGFRDW